MNLLLLGRRTAMGVLAALLLVAGFWASWGTAQHVMLGDSRERGTMRVARCTSDACVGPYTPSSAGFQPRERVVIDRSIAEKKGVRIPVAVKPGTSEVVRTGGPGFLHAWLPLGGALLLSAVVVAGGLRLPRTAWALALAGGTLLTASFATLAF
ncbi:hypothetical protein GCM10009837_48870 [Streptomyces durmitorensis]|uniref:Uncharacterized protein n=1 Tax=Streptomyces durmitorensis TaxID=319947 RepID=A0ABY4PW42_9ACTN|nr:hypothetical protein [Streptomyces durmitorensis]UQT58067.1 hypothetical protein M4V62_24900 [Streptomyces durmitorensis]